MRQGALDLPIETRWGRADFLLSKCNRAAFDVIERWPEWPARALVLCGPPGSGKTHLAHLWCERSGARLIEGNAAALEDPAALPPIVAVDDAERAPERALLHLYNLSLERGGSLLLTAPESPSAMAIKLADLASRLRSLPVAVIDPPDDALLAAVLVKHFTDRQLPLPPQVVDFLVPRIERSFVAVAQVAARIDKLALETRSRITVKLARAALAEGP